MMRTSAVDSIARSTRTARGPALLLRVEGLAVAATAAVAYHHLPVGWSLFVAFVLVPDIGLIGYLRGPAVGARTYNATHSLTVPLLLVGIGLLCGSDVTAAVALTWLTHIRVDRAAGFGLKCPTSFRETHLQRLV